VTELLRLEDLRVKRGAAEVLRGVSLHVDEGEVVTILGANGVGKSTTLRTLSGLHRPSGGTIAFQGATTNRWSPRQIVQRGLVHVPEGRHLFPSLSVRENLEMGAYVHGAVVQSDNDRALEFFPLLVDMLNRRAGTLSGGQQQMVAIARGLMSRPRILMLDEPSLGLAPQVAASIGDLIRRLTTEGISILLVEQNASLALGVSDRGYVLVQGAVTLEGTAAQLREHDDVRHLYLGT
jgi:branched-chain amino acid transport system ATP-binding protein